jgi:AcrR family transcriptional regulator
VGTAVAKESYTFGEIAAELGISHGTVRNLFRNEPGVLRAGMLTDQGMTPPPRRISRWCMAAAPAEVMGIVMEPGEDLIGAMARTKGVSRAELETYLRALSRGIPRADAEKVAPLSRVQ